MDDEALGIEALRARVMSLEAVVQARDARIATLEAAAASAHERVQVLQAVLDNTPDVVVLKDHAGNFLLCNRVAAELYGTTPSAMVGKHDGDFSATAEQAAFFRQNVLEIMARGEREVVLEDSTDDRTGEVRSFKSIKTPFIGPDGKPRILVIAHDVTDIRRAQERVAQSEQRLRHALAATGEGVWDWDLRTGAVGHNQSWLTMLKLDESDLHGTLGDFEDRLVEDEKAGVRAAIDACLRGEKPYHHEHAMRRKDGVVIRVLDRGDVVERDAAGKPLRMVGSFADITPQVEARDAIERSLREKEMLLKEIHHRVKNNLQIISSLLSLQASGVDEARAQALLRESVTRVRSMALIHQQLYLADNLARIDFAEYAGTLVHELVGSLAPDAQIHIEAERIELPVDDAVPGGLLLNELLTNALKHGRAADRTLDVHIRIRRQERGFLLEVQDNGPGLPAELDLAHTSSLGFQLVTSLARQLRAVLDVQRSPGTRIGLHVGAKA